jgi:hypothetical protein
MADEGDTPAGDPTTDLASGGIAPARAKSRINPAWLDEVERRMLRGEAPADFVPELAATFKRHKRKVWNYVALVRKRLAERAKAHDPDADREMIRALLLNAYRTAEVGHPERGSDAKGMVSAAKTLAEVTGVAAPRKVDVTSGGKPLQALSDDELRARIAELEAAVKPSGT